jgi:hypothetical protein
MSAYIVTDTTINRVLTWLAAEIRRSHYLRDKVEKATGIDTTRLAWEDELGKAMFQLNIDGITARYGSTERVRWRNFLYVATYCPPIQVLKSLQCWLYQCCEGEVPQTELYKLFDTDVQQYLMSKIITSLPEYEEAEWG